MHENVVVDEYRELVIKEACRMVADRIRSAVCQITCVCCGQPIGRTRPMRLVAIMPGGVGSCHEGCVGRLTAIGARELTLEGCDRGPHRGGYHHFIRALLSNSNGGVEAVAKPPVATRSRHVEEIEKAIHRSGKVRMTIVTENDGVRKHKEPVKRRSSPGRRTKRMIRGRRR